MLIVDDNQTNCQILVNQTESWGMMPTAVHSGMEALGLIAQGARFGVGILDQQMPGMDGITLAENLAKDLPLVLLSSLGYHDNRPGGSRFSACLTKPVKPSQLYDCLTRLVTHQPTSVLRPVAKTLFNREIGSRHPLRLLVAEDNEINQKLVSSILGRLGYRAEMANNGLEALRILHEKPFDVVLMDIQMPVMDGETATIHIRAGFPARSAAARNCHDRQRLNRRPGTLPGGRDGRLPEQADQDRRAGQVIAREPALGAAPSASSPANSGVEKGSSTPAQPSACTFDISLLREFSEMMGETGVDLAKDLLRMYRKNSLDLIDSLQQTLDKPDLPDLHRTAHTLKGNSGQVGAVRLANMCFTLEQIARNGSQDGAQALLEQIKAEFGKVECEMEKVLQLSEPAWYAYKS